LNHFQLIYFSNQKLQTQQKHISRQHLINRERDAAPKLMYFLFYYFLP